MIAYGRTPDKYVMYPGISFFLLNIKNGRNLKTIVTAAHTAISAAALKSSMHNELSCLFSCPYYYLEITPAHLHHVLINQSFHSYRQFEQPSKFSVFFITQHGAKKQLFSVPPPIFRQQKRACKNKLFPMPVTGLEPVRGCPRGILSPLRLPIPPHRQTYKYVDDGFPSSGTYRARTYDPLLVRQMLSQLS